jgi:hypothetical protein
MDWIVGDNLPFSVVESERFRHFIHSLNLVWLTPSRPIIANLIKKEYQYAVIHVKNLLRTAKGLIHLTFDGWTSRRNDSYLGINAYFVDNNWNRRSVLLVVQPFQNSHTRSHIADLVAKVLKFFKVEDR